MATPTNPTASSLASTFNIPQAQADTAAGLFATANTTPAPVPAAPKLPGRTYKTTDGRTIDESTGKVIPGAPDPSLTDEAMIRANALSDVQSSVDAVKNTYAGLLAKTQVNEANRSGRDRASQARNGLAGSTFGGAETDRVDAQNAADEQALLDEKNNKLAAITTSVNADVQNRLDKGRTQARLNETDYNNFIKDQGTKAVDYIKQLGETGHTFADLTDTEYKHLLDATGYTDEQAKVALELAKPKATVIKQEVSGNKYVSVTQDPITKKVSAETITLPFTLPSGYTAEKLSNGQVLFVPKEFDPSQPVASQVYTFGTPTAPKLKQPTVPAGQVKQENDALNWMRLQPTYKPEYEDLFKTNPQFKAQILNLADQAHASTTIERAKAKKAATDTSGA